MKKIETDNLDQAKRIKAKEAISFLNSHPALAPDVFGGSPAECLWMWLEPVCKRGIAQAPDYRMYWGEDGYERFIDKFNEEYKDSDEENKFWYIDVSYEEKYGESWVFDHVAYWYEVTFFVFSGDPYDKTGAYDQVNWNRYQGPMGGASTFEDMIIECAEECKKAFGDYEQYQDFYTEEEIKNNKENNCFNFVDVTDEEDKRKGYKELKSNDNYVLVSNGLLNLRWLKWFIETDYAKENWEWLTNINGTDKTWFEVIKKLDDVPEDRKKILEIYK